MAWQARKKYTKRPSRWSGKPTVAAVARQLDRKLSKRYQWVALEDQVCGQTALACKGCCSPESGPDPMSGCTFDATGGVTIEYQDPQFYALIWPAPPLEPDGRAAYQADTLTLVRTVGQLTLCPVFCNGAQQVALCTATPAQCALFEAYQNQFQNYVLRAGLSKDRWTYDPTAEEYAVPIRYPLSSQDWTDGRFLRQWERRRDKPNLSFRYDFSGTAPIGCCGDVSSAGAGAPANTLSNGSGTVNIPAISTDCDPCLPSNEDTFERWGYDRKVFPCLTLSLNSKRRLTFKENEGLNLWLDWSSFTPLLAPSAEWRPNIGWHARLSLKGLFEVA